MPVTSDAMTPMWRRSNYDCGVNINMTTTTTTTTTMTMTMTMMMMIVIPMIPMVAVVHDLQNDSDPDRVDDKHY